MFISRRSAFNTTNRFLAYLPFFFFVLVFITTYYLFYSKAPPTTTIENPLLQKINQEQNHIETTEITEPNKLPLLGPNGSLPPELLENIIQKKLKIPLWKETNKMKGVKLFKQFDVQR